MKNDSRTGFSELLFQINSVIGMSLAEMHLEPFDNQLKFVPKPFSQEAGVPLGIDDFSPKGFSRGANDLLNLHQ